jgi:hypothetical protein
VILAAALRSGTDQQTEDFQPIFLFQSAEPLNVTIHYNIF